MATLAKHRARKVCAVGSPSVGYADLSFPYLLDRRHATLTVGDYVMRIEAGDVLRVARELAAAGEALAKKDLRQ